MIRSHLFLIPLLLFACAAGVPMKEGGENEIPKAESIASVHRTLESRSIARLKGQSAFSFSWKKRKFTVGYGEWKNPAEDQSWNRMYGWGPVIWISENNRTRLLDLRKDFSSQRIARVFQDEESSRILIFLDSGIEGPALEYQVWISEDGGESWFQGSALLKPPGSFPPADLEDIFMDEKGKGEAWFRMEASSYEPTRNLRGDFFFRASTENGGRSWSVSHNPVFRNVLRKEDERQP